MYWVVFGLFTTVELFTDMFLQWFPFYHEMKIVFVIWLVTPATSGYSLIYRRLIHPELSKRENEIDDAISKATEKGYTKVVEFGAKGLNYAAKTFITTALMGQDFLADQLRRRSASMSDLNRHNQSYPTVSRHIRNRLGAGDQQDLAGMFNSDSRHRATSLLYPGPNSVEEDPFALNWLQPGSTGSLGRHWRPGATGLSGVPEDAEHPHEEVSRDAKSQRRPTNIAQDTVQPVTRRNSTRRKDPAQNRVC
ncbi:Receptor expression-enhancing protein 1 [Clonorchis sinensis]|uniref:Receptor expression-enhancing protein n=1 Tax=Clonorchis sinensis TaxID=79923 RepID=A0A8T1MAL9_CLOSI|nr:Receptor expression-enhancing protein 1 [Clonorchis sinensis]